MEGAPSEVWGSWGSWGHFGVSGALGCGFGHQGFSVGEFWAVRRRDLPWIVVTAVARADGSSKDGRRKVREDGSSTNNRHIS